MKKKNTKNLTNIEKPLRLQKDKNGRPPLFSQGYYRRGPEQADNLHGDPHGVMTQGSKYR